MSYTAKSIILDIADNWGDSNFLGLRSLEFKLGSVLQDIGDVDILAFYGVQNGESTEVSNIFNTSLSKIGQLANNSWLSLSGYIQNQRIICVFVSIIEFDEIVINNCHHNGGLTSRGIQNVKITSSTNIITDTTYNAAISNSFVLYNSTFDQHIGSDIIDDQVLVLNIPVTYVEIEYESIYYIGDIINIHESIYYIGDIINIHESVLSILVSLIYESFYNIFALVININEIKYSIGYISREYSSTFSLMGILSQEQQIIYDICVLRNEHEFIFKILQGSTINYEFPYNLSTSVISVFETEYSLLAYNIIQQLYIMPYVLHQSAETILNTFESDINFITIDISQDNESFCFLLNAEIESVESWIACSSGSEISITINSVEFIFIIDERSRTRLFNDTIYNISGRSKTSKLLETQIVKTWDLTTAKQVIEELCTEYGISLDYQIIDWVIQKGLLIADGEYAIDIIKKIANACGGIVQTNPQGVLQIYLKYEVSPLDYTNPIFTISDVNDIFNIVESKIINPKYNEVYVLDYQETDDQNYNIVQDQDILKIWVFPFQASITLENSYILSGLSIEFVGLIEEEKIEVVEIIQGLGSVSFPILNVISYDFNNNEDLGIVTFTNTKIMTNIKAQSLLNIKYITQYHKYKVSNIIENKVQFYIEKEE